MSEQTDATEDRQDDEAVEQAREDRERLAEGASTADEPQPWAKTSSGDAE